LGTLQLSPAPLVGWRAWWLHDGRLHSWNLNYVWSSGPVRAECQAGRLLDPPVPPRHDAPGHYCKCGLWALWTLSACLEKARHERLLMAPGYFPVIGVISAWGEVALHGDEGFRAQFARIDCLLADSIWDAVFDRLVPCRARLTRGLRTLLPALAGRRTRAVARAAANYGIPALPLGQALEIGLLGELGARVR
jgi:hypothetical protein